MRPERHDAPGQATLYVHTRRHRPFADQIPTDGQADIAERPVRGRFEPAQGVTASTEQLKQ